MKYPNSAVRKTHSEHRVIFHSKDDSREEKEQFIKHGNSKARKAKSKRWLEKVKARQVQATQITQGRAIPQAELRIIAMPWWKRILHWFKQLFK